MYKLVVLFSVVALAAGAPGVGVLAPVAYSSVVPGVSSLSQYSSSVVHGAGGLPLAYSGALLPGYATLAQAPHAPALVLDAARGVPLDTPEVVAARAQHYHAKALSGLHLLKKRSVAPLAYSALASPLAYSSPLVSSYSAPLVSSYSAPLVSTYAAAPLVSSPLAYHGVVPKAYGVHAW